MNTKAKKKFTEWNETKFTFPFGFDLVRASGFNWPIECSLTQIEMEMEIEIEMV